MCSTTRIFPPDVLHTVSKGIVEYALGFTLQIIEVIGEIDAAYVDGGKMLCKAIRDFPAYNSFHPVRHVSIFNIFDFYNAKKSKSRSSNPLTVTGNLKMKETYKSASALLQILFAIMDLDILPRGYDWCIQHEFESPYFCVKQVIVNAINSIFDVIWFVNAESLTMTQLETMKMLIANAQGHMMVLDMVRRRLLLRSMSKTKVFVDVDVTKATKLGTPKMHSLSHFPESIIGNGCSNYVRDTSRGESEMKSIKELYSQVSKRRDSADNEMLVRYQHLHYLTLMKDGLKARGMKEREISKKHVTMKSFMVVSSGVLDFFINRSYKNQQLGWSEQSQTFEVDRREEFFQSHPILLQVPCFYFFLLVCDW